MDDAIRAWLSAQLGPTTAPIDLAARYTRLGSARAVALEVLRERKAGLLLQPGSIAVSGVVSLNNAENIKALERQIAELEAGHPPAPDEIADETTGDAPHPIHLIARRRR